MIQITNKLKLIITLNDYINGCELEVHSLTKSTNFEETILLNQDNDNYEIYEIFCACMLNLHLVAIQNEEFELAKQIIRAHNKQSRIMKDITDAGQDMDTISWRWYIDQFFNETIQSQLLKYAKYGK